MSELPISSKYRSQPELPVADDERDQLSRRLNSAFTDGRIDSDDYRQRLDQLFAARTMGDLIPVVEGLPPAATYDQPGIVAQSSGQPGELAPARSGTRAAAVITGSVAAAVLVLIILLVILL